MRSSDQPNPTGAASSFDAPSSTSTFDLEPLLYAFEQAWQAGDRPPIETLLAQLPLGDPAADSAQRRLLEEMVKIDLEYRWRGSAFPGDDELPARPLLEDYLLRFASLGPLERLSPELIGEEYRVRRLWGDRPDAQNYYARFPVHAELPALLARIDAELAERVGLTTVQTKARLSEIAVPLRAVPDGYQFLGELGRGGMGVVHKARQLRLNRLVAIKMIRAGDEAGPAALARFRTEAEAAARVQHPNIVQVHEIGEKDGQPYCVMEYVNGGSLSRCLAGTPLEANAAARLLETLARAVQAIHDQGILHRDLKPANILLHLTAADDKAAATSALLQSPVCVPKISDFGLAKPAESAGLTQTGMVLGTPSYMAPEQADSQSEVIGPTTDVYGLGAIFYELLTGRPPFRGVTVLETLEQVRRHDPLPPRQLQPAAPRDLETICLKCLQKERGKRYASAAALADDLECFRQNRPIRARPAGRWERGLKLARRRPALATLAAALLFGVIFALAGGLTYTLHLRAARQRAGRSYRKALEAVEQMLVHMGAERMEAIPGTEKAQEDALKEAVRLYQELLGEQERPDPDLYARLGFALSYLGNLQMGLGQTDQAEQSCRRSLELLDNLPGELGNARVWHQSAFARYILGNILTARNQRAEAEQLYQEACDILTPLGGDAETRDLLGNCYTGLGTLSNNLTRSREHYRRAMEISEELYKKAPSNWHYCFRYGKTLYNLAHNASTAGRANEAETLFQRCIDLLQPIVVLAATVNDQPAARLQSQVVLFHCYEGLGMLLMARRDTAKGESFIQKAIAESEKLVQLYPHPERRQELAQCCLNLGVHYQVSQQWKKAKEVYRKGAVILEALVRDLPDIAPYRLTLAHIYVNLGLLYSGESVEEALIVFHKGRDLLEPLCREHPEDARYAYALCAIYNNEAGLLRNRGEPDKALLLLDRAIEAASTALGRDPTNGSVKYTCTMALATRAQTWTDLHKHKKALADWDRLLKVVGSVGADKYRCRRALTLAQLGNHSQAIEDIDKYLLRPGISSDERYFGVAVLSANLGAAQKDPHLTGEQRKKQE
ncbi:MAG TPA: protein kinase, partial [Gemmataceae bacterium]|nr:protein kinase [Gemmataceae bacterium]